MKVLTRVVQITSGRRREFVDALGDVSKMVAVPTYQTNIQGRLADITEWYDPVTFNGYEVTAHHLDERDQ